MYTDRNGAEIKQVTVWLPAAVHRLVRADHLNLSQFLRDQLDVLYGDQSAAETLDQKARLILSARESTSRQKAIDEETLEARERLYLVTRKLRDERAAEREQQQAAELETASRTAAIGETLDAIIGDDSPDRYSRLLPENDKEGDHIDDFDALVARVSRRCGTDVDSSEVIAELRRRTARLDSGGET